ncbi:hypothetical protein [Streptomyces avermitilis]|uniref:hypothetical protein n=1 Tax=Streptomyces avermitilis TaxID=33903 RepID=UPI003CD0C038
MSDYWTPAHQAVEQEDAEALAQLLAAGFDPDEAFSNMMVQRWRPSRCEVSIPLRAMRCLMPRPRKHRRR